jgi:hypothetical protein
MRYVRVTSEAGNGAQPRSATLNLRIDPALKEALRIAALQDHRSIANLVEVLIRRHCTEQGISIPEQQDLSLGDDDE